MIVYHYTHRRHLESILREGKLRTTESNIGAPPGAGMKPVGEHVGPDVLWVTDLSDPSVPLGIDPPPGYDPAMALLTGQDKTQVRFTLDLPDREVYPWIPWAKSRGADKKWLAILKSLCDASHTYIIQREVPESEWVAIHVRHNGAWTNVRVSGQTVQT